MPAFQAAVSESLAASTMRGYTQQFTAFRRWCTEHSVPHLPAEPLTVALYLTDKRSQGASYQALRNPVHAINHFHRTANLPLPGDAAAVKQVLEAAQRQQSAPTKKMEPLELAHVAAICARYAQPGCQLQDLMTCTAISTAFFGMLRYDDFSRITVGDLEFSPGQLTIFFGRRKNDQYREGSRILLPATPHTLHCPVSLISRLLDRTGTAAQPSRPLFAAGHTVASYGSVRIGYDTMSALCRTMFAGIGLDPTKYNTHSLRAGGASAASNADVPMEQWMEQGNWRSRRAAQGYVKTDDSRKLQVAHAIMGSPPSAWQPPLSQAPQQPPRTSAEAGPAAPPPPPRSLRPRRPAAPPPTAAPHSTQRSPGKRRLTAPAKTDL